MGIVMHFGSRHERDSAISRAAKEVSRSELSPERVAISVRSIEDQYSAGMLFRCHHFATVGTRTETSDAIASLEGQSATTSRKVSIPVAMAGSLGQLVLKCKDNLALDGKKTLGHTVPMADSDQEAQYKQEFIARVKAARIATGKKQWQVAELMGIKQDQYKHYEVSRLMPLHLIGRFCLLTNVDPTWLVTSRGAKPLKPPHIVEQEPQPVPRPKRAKRSRAA